MGILLETNDVHAGYGKKPVLESISFKVTSGNIVLFIGPNGAGKSTILKALTGLADVTSGKIKFHGMDVTHWPPWKVIGSGVAYCPQGDVVFRNMSVEENLLMAFYAKGDPVDKSTVESILALFPALKDKLKYKASQLSGGEQKMLGLARALSNKPKLLLLDEPSLGLAPKGVQEVLEKIVAIKNAGVTILMVEHRVEQVMPLADTVIGLRLGRIKFQLNPLDISEKQMKELYL